MESRDLCGPSMRSPAVAPCGHDELPTWFVPESPAGYTVATLMVCWGIWAMGAGLQGACGRK